eukprot:c13790_g1_i1.p1 GENE.c13790_g1_i1~~c13790_g1_i1.p1  ORF type:complete len:528 (+),score=80.94 c13790_g1_i1:212-1585(+)
MDPSMVTAEEAASPRSTHIVLTVSDAKVAKATAEHAQRQVAVDHGTPEALRANGEHCKKRARRAVRKIAGCAIFLCALFAITMGTGLFSMSCHDELVLRTEQLEASLEQARADATRFKDETYQWRKQHWETIHSVVSRQGALHRLQMEDRRRSHEHFQHDEQNTNVMHSNLLQRLAAVEAEVSTIKAAPPCIQVPPYEPVVHPVQTPRGGDIPARAFEENDDRRDEDGEDANVEASETMDTEGDNAQQHGPEGGMCTGPANLHLCHPNVARAFIQTLPAGLLQRTIHYYAALSRNAHFMSDSDRVLSSARVRELLASEAYQRENMRVGPGLRFDGTQRPTQQASDDSKQLKDELKGARNEILHLQQQLVEQQQQLQQQQQQQRWQRRHNDRSNDDDENADKPPMIRWLQSYIDHASEFAKASQEDATRLGRKVSAAVSDSHRKASALLRKWMDNERQ